MQNIMEQIYIKEKRNILKIPQLTPGMMGGKAREINMRVPFNFKTNK